MLNINIEYMPIKKSAKKELRKSEKKRVQNLRKTRKIKDLTKKFQSLLKDNKTEEAKKMISDLYKAIDKAAKTNVIKKNTAARRKSVIAKKVK